ncbi:dienelactone hydrolase family protein [Gloeobacter kilaueensis]|uniref:Carboxymethylenebutenolidase n=1 Tax=Gloeobacter kilaueensis (strain ATCC BAA-2537 / CCAP 1431/1 / ULC 316 / JS1) TaxID=1183438 RepID=U5QG18_GLOK1|nr:dienelactone hydrolase family protein [Gloeobacter kilaueensis]AGY56625.1 carboxymethylenebutenolidase [Gloeobacter kilaueensis JS1]
MDSQIRSVLPKTDFNRRSFVVTSIAAGFALAVLPVGAATITTDTTGLVAGEVKIPVKGGEIPAYRALPVNGGNNLPVVLIVHEIFGVHEHIQDLCRRYAKLGYYAIAPDLYARQGDVKKLTSIQDIVTKVVSKTPDEQVLLDLDATVAYLAGKANTDKLAVTGFCWGGRIVWLYAAHNPKVKAAGAWYGRLVGDTDPNHPENPIDIASKLKVPVLGLYGGKDQGIPLASIEQMRRVLKEAGNPSEIVVYSQAEHGFNADYRPSYNPEAAKDAQQKLLAWFKKYGVA